MINALTVDLEEYFHPAEVQLHVEPSTWSTWPSRIAFQTERILDLLDRHGTMATFFVLGWVAERHPAVIRRIASRGHEVACHSFAHQLVYALSPESFREDTRRAVMAIEDACGLTPVAYRAPNYSITGQSLWALEVLVECGFRRDSSIYPIRHDRYGIPGFDRHAVTLQTPAGPIQEIPAATVLHSSGVVSPVGGGAYLRLLPYRYTAAGIRHINEEEAQPVCMYFHPWEIDPQQPRIAQGLISRLRTYTGIASMYNKLDRLLSDFRFSSMNAVYGVAGAGAGAAAAVSGR